MKEIKADTNEWKAVSLCSWIGRISTVKIFVLSEVINRFIAISIKILMAFFTAIEKNNSKICMESQKTLSSQSNFEQEEQSWKHHISWFQNILQTYSNQNTMVLAVTTDMWMSKHNSEPRNKPIHVQGCQEYTMEKEQSLQEIVLGKLDSHMQKNKIWPSSYTKHKNQFKMD